MSAEQSGFRVRGDENKSDALLKPKTPIRYAVAVAVFGVLCALAAWVAPEGEQGSRAAWCSIIPPVLAISLAFLTRNVLLSLGIAILGGGLLSEVPQAPLSIVAWFRGLTTAGSLVGAAGQRRPDLHLSQTPIKQRERPRQWDVTAKARAKQIRVKNHNPSL